MKRTSGLLLVVLVSGMLVPAAVAQRPPQESGSLEQRLLRLEDRIDSLQQALRRADYGFRAAETYERIRRGVVRVEAGLSIGSGFVVPGPLTLIATNDHVIDGGEPLRVLLDASTRVSARVVARDGDKDLALLYIHPDACAECPVLPLKSFHLDDRPVVVPGERVFAVGFPIGQSSVLTSGIVSSVRDWTIMSDVNLNPGNSGGPLLNLDGDVVGVNTFLVQGDRGPGVSGSNSVVELAKLIGRATDTIGPLEPPDVRALPVLKAAFPIARLRDAATAASADTAYGGYTVDGGRFSIALRTPLYHAVLMHQLEAEVARDRRRREERARLPSESRYSEFRPLREWMEHVGDLGVPAVAIQVTPKLSQTTGSVVSAILAGLATGLSGIPTATQGRYRFEGDLARVELYRNGKLMEPVRGGVQPVKVYELSRFLDVRDVANHGTYLYTPDVFAPRPGQLPPRIILRIVDMKNPADSLRNLVTLSPTAVARIWNDFDVYYRSVEPRNEFVRADAQVPFYAGDMLQVRGKFEAAVSEAMNRLIGARFHIESTEQPDPYVQMRQWFVREPQSDFRARVTLRDLGSQGVALWILTDDEALKSRLSVIFKDAVAR